jgi:hypothetical protein
VCYESILSELRRNLLFAIIKGAEQEPWPQFPVLGVSICLALCSLLFDRRVKSFLMFS